MCLIEPMRHLTAMTDRYGVKMNVLVDASYLLQLKKLKGQYPKLQKDFEGGIELEPSEEGFTPITGEAGRREKKKDPLTVIIDKINERYALNQEGILFLNSFLEGLL